MVYDEHKPFTDDGVTYCGFDGHEGCGELWPCSTVRALEDAPHRFALPSKHAPLAHLTAFYDKATFNKDGSVTLVLKVPADEKPAVVALSDNDGKALNVTVWETLLPEGMAELARAVGLD